MSVCLCQWTVCTVKCTVDCTVGYNRFVQQSPILYLPPHNLFLSLSTQSAFEPPDRNVYWWDLCLTDLLRCEDWAWPDQPLLSHGCQTGPSCLWRPTTSPWACRLDQSNQCRSVSSHDKGKWCQLWVLPRRTRSNRFQSYCRNCSNVNNFLSTLNVSLSDKKDIISIRRISRNSKPDWH